MANTSKIRGISFPFRRGQFQFPAASVGAETVVDAVKSLLLIGPFEVPFAPNLGTNIHSFIFESLSPIQQARIGQAIRNLIAQNEPRMVVQSVQVLQEGSDVSGYAYTVRVVYTIADIEGNFDIPLGV
jgi:phage baseplate assembly protein W